MLDVEDDLLTEYLAESREQLSGAESDLLDLEKSGLEVDDQRMNRVFRVVHTIKGGAGFFELHKIGELAHQAENVLDLMRSRQLVPTPESIAVLLRAIDSLTDMVNHPATSNAIEIGPLLAAIAAVAQGESNDAEPHLPHPPEGRSLLHFLIVEDDFTSRLLLQNFLSRYGTCHIAVNGREAVGAFEDAFNRHESYDLVCMDIRMPEMDGRQAVRQMRTIEEARGILSSHGARIVMVSSISEIREIFRCFEELCDAYLVKPVDLAQFTSHLKTFHLVQ